MQVRSKPKEKSFIPFDITLTIENEAEAMKIFCVCNHCLNTGFVPDLALIREKIKDEIGKDYIAMYVPYWERFVTRVRNLRKNHVG